MNHPVHGRYSRGSRQNGRLLVRHGMNDLGDCVAAERRHCREHLEQHGAHGEQIGAGVARAPEDDFGRHVPGRTRDRSGQGERDISLLDSRHHAPREAKIEQLDTVRRKKDIRRL